MVHEREQAKRRPARKKELYLMLLVTGPAITCREVLPFERTRDGQSAVLSVSASPTLLHLPHARRFSYGET